MNKHTPLVIFDLDGTLALNEHRQHLVRNGTPDWAAFFQACDKDTPNWNVIEILRHHYKMGCIIVILSGRSDEVEAKTRAWLQEYRVPHDKLVMRPEGDYTPDKDLKRSWLAEIRRNGGSVLCVYDDRDSVVAMWREEGITCCQVAEGDF